MSKSAWYKAMASYQATMLMCTIQCHAFQNYTCDTSASDKMSIIIHTPLCIEEVVNQIGVKGVEQTTPGCCNLTPYTKAFP